VLEIVITSFSKNVEKEHPALPGVHPIVEEILEERRV
jgi:hypothetical protein